MNIIGIRPFYFFFSLPFQFRYIRWWCRKRGMGMGWDTLVTDVSVKSVPRVTMVTIAGGGCLHATVFWCEPANQVFIMAAISSPYFTSHTKLSQYIHTYIHSLYDRTTLHHSILHPVISAGYFYLVYLALIACSSNWSTDYLRRDDF